MLTYIIYQPLEFSTWGYTHSFQSITHTTRKRDSQKTNCVFFLSSSSFQDFPFVFHVFSLKKVVVFFRHQNVGPFRALRTHHGGYITPPSAHRGGPPGRDVTTERASWISTVPTTTNKPPEVFGCYWMQLEDERVLLFCCFFLCVLCLKVRFKCVVFLIMFSLFENWLIMKNSQRSPNNHSFQSQDPEICVEMSKSQNHCYENP